MHRADRVLLNISGEIYETRTKTLERFPNTLLGDRNKRLLYYCAATGQHVFYRNKIFFDAILFFYQSNGILECPYDIPVDLFEAECRFFQMPQYAIDTLLPHEGSSPAASETEIYDRIKESSIKSKLWGVLQEPNTSSLARFYARFSMFMIFASVAASCLETMKELRVESKEITKNPWALTELVLNLWFLLELLANIIATPNMKRYFKQFMTWVDIISVVPYFILMTVSEKQMASLGFLRSIRLMRIVRIFRLSKHSEKLQLIAKVLSSSMEEFKTLFIIVMMTVILAGSTMYYIETQFASEEDKQKKAFTDIPDAIYWGIQTITTLGYGDITPQSLAGMVFAGFFMLFGSVILAIPVQTVITKYQETELY